MAWLVTLFWDTSCAGSTHTPHTHISTSVYGHRATASINQGCQFSGAAAFVSACLPNAEVLATCGRVHEWLWGKCKSLKQSAIPRRGEGESVGSVSDWGSVESTWLLVEEAFCSNASQGQFQFSAWCKCNYIQASWSARLIYAHFLFFFLSLSSSHK